jgi:exopolysaccharide biosynthesis polyprenyl glycosylphosphotransferase
MARSSGSVIAAEPGVREIPITANPPLRGRGRRGRLIRRALFSADVIGLLVAFVGAELWYGAVQNGSVANDVLKLAIFFVASLPVWVLVAHWYGLYDKDEERTEHSTTDDLSGVFHLVTVGVWVLYAGAWLSGITTPQLRKTTLFWAVAIAAIVAGRAIARWLVRRSSAYLQNTLIVGGGKIGQLVARKYLLHPEYGIRLVGIVDDHPREWRAELEGVNAWSLDDLERIVEDHDVERVVIAFSNLSTMETLETIRRLREARVQIDIVPRLFEVVSPNVSVHSVEGLPLLGLPPVHLSRSAALTKRLLDIVVASLLLVVTAPLFAYIALRIRRGSPGPVFFMQTRLGQDMHPFVALKFRTMTIGDNDDAHREYVRSIMSADATVQESGNFKLDRPEVTPFGSWLRATSLDELPQLINVLRGEMSLVGPRPCIAYETAHFEPHHFERFLVPAGLTGLWQVTARARSTFGEALDMDVAYARGWSLKLDLWILARTPAQVFRRSATA